MRERGKLSLLSSFCVFGSVAGDEIEQLLSLVQTKWVFFFLTSDQHIFSPYIVKTLSSKLVRRRKQVVSY